MRSVFIHAPFETKEGNLRPYLANGSHHFWLACCPSVGGLPRICDFQTDRMGILGPPQLRLFHSRTPKLSLRLWIPLDAGDAAGKQTCYPPPSSRTQSTAISDLGTTLNYGNDVLLRLNGPGHCCEQSKRRTLTAEIFMFRKLESGVSGVSVGRENFQGCSI
jgi:hypothetical protein